MPEAQALFGDADRDAVPAVESDIEPPANVFIAGRRVTPTIVFDTYWRFSARRQAIYQARLENLPGPWTDDPILQEHRFTNCFRAADRVSQYLISNVIYRGDQEATEVVFRTLLFKMFNRISTWELLESTVGPVEWRTFDAERYNKVLSDTLSSGQRLYSAAYVIPPPKFGAERKHSNHLRLLEYMMESGLTSKLQEADSMRTAFEVLGSYPAIGDFLAFQYLIDINYADVLGFDEMDFVVAGPGARDGLRKCFGPQAAGIESDLIRLMADTQAENFARLGLEFEGLRGRALQLIDCQNLFCEVDKYARVAHPDVSGLSGRSRIKQRFNAQPEPLTAWFPPKWGINHDTTAIELEESSSRSSTRGGLTRAQASTQVWPKSRARSRTGASASMRPAATVS